MGATAGNTDDKEMSKAIIKEPAILEISKKVEKCYVQTFKRYKIVRIASGADHLILLDTEGSVWSMGCAESGQLGRVSFFNLFEEPVCRLVLFGFELFSNNQQFSHIRARS